MNNPFSPTTPLSHPQQPSQSHSSSGGASPQSNDGSLGSLGSAGIHSAGLSGLGPDHIADAGAGGGGGVVAGSQAPPQTVPAACLACRSKHLKCDGQTPCSRCTSSNVHCMYVASRRGYKGPRRTATDNPNKRQASSPPPMSAPDMYSVHPHQPSIIPAAITAGFSSAAMTMPASPASTAFLNTPAQAQMQLFRNPFAPGGLDIGSNHSLALATGAPLPMQPAVAPLAEQALESYFHHYHAAHPCTLPHAAFMSLLKDRSSGTLDHLVAAMRYAGSLFIDSAGPAGTMYLEEALRLAYLPTTPKDGFLVQTLLLLILVFDGCSLEPERGRRLLADAEQIALEIGLHRREFAAANGRGNPLLEESWRRTWWELYVVCGLIAGVRQQTNFALFDVNANVGLPCEEHEYLSGDIPSPMYMEDFDDEVFSGEDRPFSSGAYRVAAARNLGRLIRASPIRFPGDENLAKIESHLTNFKMHLPMSKRDDLTKSCTLDEMMFQAHFITHACTIRLHQPHSQLDSSPARTITACAPHTVVPYGDAFNSHTRHVITAAAAMSQMVTQAVPLLRHAHFFTCVVTLSSTVHLAKWAALYFIRDDPSDNDLRQLVRLNIGALREMSRVWKCALPAYAQVKSVAQEIYRAKKAQQINPAFWVAFTQDEMISSLNTDEGIMSEFGEILAVSQAAPA